MNTGTLISYGKKISRDDLALIPTPDATRTHQPIPHHKIVQSLTETLSFRHIGVLKDEYAVSGNGMKMFGVLDLETGFEGCRFSIGIRNSHDKSFRLAVTTGLRVTVCENMMFNGDFTLATIGQTVDWPMETGGPVRIEVVVGHCGNGLPKA